MKNLTVKEILGPFASKLEKMIRDEMDNFGSPSRLKEACDYALTNGGKRFRPAIVFLIAKCLGSDWPISQIALAIEYFHTASLIADDLPSMDNDNERRNRPSTHIVFGEDIALLASYALIAQGYHCLSVAVAESKSQVSGIEWDRMGILALENATYNTGIFGATGGQFLDLFPPDQLEGTLREVIEKKTISLFEISFVLGWLFAKGDDSRLDEVKRLAAAFGMAFQIADDFDDLQQDIENGIQSNYALVLGYERAEEIFNKEIETFEELLKSLGLYSQEFKGIICFLQEQVERSLQAV